MGLLLRPIGYVRPCRRRLLAALVCMALGASVVDAEPVGSPRVNDD